MVNDYKALAFLGTGNKEAARVEFNRVGDRQARAEEEFAKDKAKLDDAAQRKASGSFDLDGAIHNAQRDPICLAAQAEFGKFANYRPFINPAATYLAAIQVSPSPLDREVPLAHPPGAATLPQISSDPLLQHRGEIAVADRKAQIPQRPQDHLDREMLSLERAVLAPRYRVARCPRHALMTQLRPSWRLQQNR
jgi:hypothetical protein